MTGELTRSSRGDAERSIDRAIHWIHANLAQPLRAAEAARPIHVTPAAFSRYFSREMGRSFTEYVNDVRCSEACLRLSLSLSHSDRAIAEFAAESGFSTLSNFTIPNSSTTSRPRPAHPGATRRSLERGDGAGFYGSGDGAREIKV